MIDWDHLVTPGSFMISEWKAMIQFCLHVIHIFWEILVCQSLTKKNYIGGTLSTPFWCLCQKLSLSPLYFNKTLITQKLWAIKPHLWPRIEFFSSGGQESRCLHVIQQQPFNNSFRGAVVLPSIKTISGSLAFQISSCPSSFHVLTQSGDSLNS